MKRIIAKTTKIITTMFITALFLPVDSFAQQASLSYAAESSAGYLTTEANYNFGFFVSIFLVLALSGLLYILNNKVKQSMK